MKRQIRALLPSPFLRFVVSGGIAAGVNVGARILLSSVMSYEAAVVVAYLAGMTTAFLLMKLFVFEESGNSAGHEYLRFGLVNLVALAQVWLVSVGLARWFFPLVGFVWHADTIAHMIGVLSPIATSYVGHKSFTFAARKK